MNKKNFKNVIKKAFDDAQFSALSPLMENREQLKLKASEIDGLTLTIEAIHPITYTKNEQEEHYAVVWFKEYPENFYFAGKRLTMWADCLFDAYDRNLDELMADFLAEPVKVKFFTSELDGGKKSMTDFELIEE